MAGKKKDYKESYELVNAELNLDALNTVEEKSRKIIMAASEVQGDICSCSDKIKIDNLDTANDLMGIKMSKGEWGKIVDTCIAIDEKGADPKLLEKLSDEERKSKLVAGLHTMLKEKALGGSSIGLEMPSEVKDADIVSDVNDSFTDILNESISNKKDIKDRLNKHYKILSEAWQYLWNYQFDGSEFHKIVDDLHYEFGGYPKEDTPPRTWTALRNFQRFFKTMCQVGLTDYMNEYLAYFGLKCEIVDPTIIRDCNGGYPTHEGIYSEEMKKEVEDETIADVTKLDSKSDSEETDEREMPEGYHVAENGDWVKTEINPETGEEEVVAKIFRPKKPKYTTQPFSTDPSDPFYIPFVPREID